MVSVAGGEEEAVRWATAAHALDYDDLHLPSTAHISAVCIPAVLAVDPARDPGRAYLAGAGVMARVGTALGWEHYRLGWHVTCTAGVFGAAVAAAVAAGLDEPATARAIALALPAAGGVQRSFGTMAKPLQVGFAAAAGVRAARLAAAGAGADLSAVEAWFPLVGGALDSFDVSGEAIPGGLAVKVYPCCYALQRPIAAAATLAIDAGEVEEVVCRTPASALQPLIHARPATGLEGKFSLEYGVAAALLDREPGFASFSDDCVRRPHAQQLMTKVKVEASPGGKGLLEGVCAVEVQLRSGERRTASLELPPGAPGNPPSTRQLDAKARDCCGDLAGAVLGLEWADAAAFLRHTLD